MLLYIHRNSLLTSKIHPILQQAISSILRSNKKETRHIDSYRKMDNKVGTLIREDLVMSLITRLGINRIIQLRRLKVYSLETTLRDSRHFSKNRLLLDLVLESLLTIKSFSSLWLERRKTYKANLIQTECNLQEIRIRMNLDIVTRNQHLLQLGLTNLFKIILVIREQWRLRDLRLVQRKNKFQLHQPWCIVERLVINKLQLPRKIMTSKSKVSNSNPEIKKLAVAK